MHEYSPADLQRLLHLPAAVIGALAHARYISAAADGRTAYTFQDMLVLRTAGALNSAQVSTPKIVAAIGHIRATLSPGSVLASMAIAALGEELRDGAHAWESHSHQQPGPSGESKGATVAALAPSLLRSPSRAEAEVHYARGHALEESDVAAARAAYLDALNAHSEHLDARINLGRLLHLDGELKAAEKVYRAAKTSSALLSFNLAILLEDLNREEEAIAAYREALAQDPSLHDAHYNLSRLHERARQPREALRHLLAYRRHIARQGDRH
jgi:tetratricopeptide (TPR) repeat protein